MKNLWLENRDRKEKIMKQLRLKTISENIQNDKKFFKYVRNTYNDLIQIEKSDTTKSLKKIIDTKSISLLGSQELYTVIKIREELIELIKDVQDKKTFKIVNKEHRYMKSVLDRYFIENLTVSKGRIDGSISVVGSISVRDK